MKSVAIGAVVVALALPANAQAAAVEARSGQGDVALTIYNNNLALIQDRRRLDLPAGKSRQELPDVSAQMRPETVTLSAPGAAVVEQNFDFDLLTPAKLLDKSVGQAVTVVRTNPATGAETAETAQVLANNQGTLLQIGGRIEVLGGLGARVVFPSLPADLRSRPTLSVTLDADKAGARPVSLSYLSRGFGWKADYVTLFDEAAGKIDVQGWITLRNDSGTSFADARVLLVAGSVGSDDSDNRQYYRPPRPPGAAAGVESSNRERLGDFYVYPIAGRTTVANAQQKQVSFLDVKGAPAAKAYVYRNQWLENHDAPESVGTVLRFSTSRSGGLGDALPAGVMRVYLRDARGLPQFIGEKSVDHTAMGAPVSIATGEAFDVKVQPTIVKRDRITSEEWEQTARWRVTRNNKVDVVGVERAVVYWRTSMNYKITNARPQPVVVEITQAGLDNRWGDTRVPSESVHGEQRTLDERVWRVSVPANGETVLSAQFDTRY